MDSEKHECLCGEWRKDPQRRDSTGQELKVIEHSLYSVRAADEKERTGAVDLHCIWWGQGGLRSWWLGLVTADSEGSSWTKETGETVGSY